MMINSQSPQNVHVEDVAAPRRSRFQESWRLFKKNKLAFVGLAIFIVFFFTALTGLILTSGTKPVFDPALVRLQEKLRPPLSRPNLEALSPEELPTLGMYLFGTVWAVTYFQGCYRGPGSL
jgi:hypothetical protein